ncbi:Ig-like and fibronectin type-III domain-containing protein C27B7,7 [Rhizoctonia solani]|uniref:Ig-like and fibronectin type-III domain-containing protein C27B7,7 n=1 Tax=Rhizoctonia solani TaxID=456999 RepID=A0A0K6G3F4_9AGAM|nr:Ig-like and fibronectin type-III domain-containing protein C27B7,7 [Rhizoctonia solani]
MQPSHLRPEFPPHLQPPPGRIPSHAAPNEDDWMDIDEGDKDDAHGRPLIPNQQDHVLAQDLLDPPGNQPKPHGYASVEVHPNGARVIRWEYNDEPEHPIDPKDVLRQKRYFEVCEWLMRQKISNAKRAEFLNLEIMKDARLPWDNAEELLNGSKYAWPVYATIGNICSHVRRRPSEHAMMLIGYVPVAKLEWITDEEERRQKKWEVYHTAMSMILEPLRDAARQGVEMLCADGGVRRVHPILSTQIGDWPELCTAGVCQNTRCPVCIVPFSERGNLGQPWRLRTKPEILTAFNYAHCGFAGMQVGLGLRPTWPYWAHHPWSSGPAGFVPDLLHQLWKGMFLTHLKTWWTKLLGRTELDERYAGIPRYSTQRHFGNISSITQWTGNEARGLARVFLPIVAGDYPRLAVQAARAMMDFIYRVRQPQLDADDLSELDNELREFHAAKWIFRSRGVHTARYKFNGIAKLHMMEHYTHQIREFGAPSGYSTEIPERLHIDYVKNPYGTTNGIDPYDQMILNLQRSEALTMRRAMLERSGVIQPRKRRYQPTTDDVCNEDDDDEEQGVEDGHDQGHEADPAQPLTRRKEPFVYHPQPQVTIAKTPTESNIKISAIIARNRAPGFLEALKRYVEVRSSNLAFQLNLQTKLGVYARFKLVHNCLPFAPLTGGRTDLVRATPARRNRHGVMTRAPCFDTVLIEQDYDALGLQRYRAGRVLIIFILPAWFSQVYPDPLAYVELFDDFTLPSALHRLSATKPLLSGGKRVRKIVPLSKIRMTCQLVPDYWRLRRQFPNLRITAETDTLSIANRFFLNRHISYYFFSLTDHWRRVAEMGR